MNNWLSKKSSLLFEFIHAEVFSSSDTKFDIGFHIATLDQLDRLTWLIKFFQQKNIVGEISCWEALINKYTQKQTTVS